MGKQINTIESPITFLKGEVTTDTPSNGYTACGPGTTYPAQASLYQIGEMFLRCRNTVIEQYEVIHKRTDIAYESSTLFNSKINPPKQNFIDGRSDRKQLKEWKQFVSRGRYFSSSNGSNSGWLSANCDQSYSAISDGLGYPTDAKYYDAKDELCVWPPEGVFQGDYLQGGLSHVCGHFGFDQYSPPSTYGAYRKNFTKRQIDDYRPETDYGYANIQFLSFPEVAFVGGDTPFSAGVKLYPNIFFLDEINGHSSFDSDRPFGGLAEIVLSSGTLSFPVYLTKSSHVTTQLVKPPRLKVTEWWPYAKSDGSPAWDAATGKPL